MCCLLLLLLLLLQEINQLRSEQDNEEPILGSRIDCVQVSGERSHP
jgi:hypothetical protein